MTSETTPVLFLSEGKKLNISELASDLVLFGQGDLDGVLRAHSIDELQLEQLLEDPVLKSNIEQLRKRLEADPQAIVRMKASVALEAHITTLNNIAGSPGSEDKDRHAAIRLLAELADALPKQAKQAANSGITVNFQMMSPAGPPTVRPVNVIEGEWSE